MSKPFEELNLYASQRVLFVNNGSLLDEGVLGLVDSSKEFEILKVDYDGDALLAQDILAIEPDIVLMSQANHLKLESFFEGLFKNPALENLRVIIFHSDDNWLDVFCNGSVKAIDSDAFLALVHGGSIVV